MKYYVYACEKSVCISLEQNVQFALFLGVDPCYIGGQVIIGLLNMGIHSELCSIFLELVDNW